MTITSITICLFFTKNIAKTISKSAYYKQGYKKDGGNMNKFLVLISISALFAVSNSFGDYIVCSEDAITNDNAETICKELCKNYGGWTEAYNTAADSICQSKFSCKCNSSPLDFPI